MIEILTRFSKLGNFFVEFILSLLVAACVAFVTFGFYYFKSAKTPTTKIGAIMVILTGVFFVAMIFWYFIVFISLKKVV